LRIPYRLLGGKRGCALHDWIVARRLEHLADQVDIVHCWPLGALRTLKAARKLGIASVLERPNAHTRFAYEVVDKECRKLGITMPPGHEHAFNAEYLRLEQEEYEAADTLLCPSDFVARTFRDEGFPPEKLARHQYGFDDKVFSPGNQNANDGRGLQVLFAGGCAPRKGLHYALEAWLQSSACDGGTFQVAGEFIPGYAEKLATMLAHPTVKVLGYRKDVPELMRQSDIFVLPSIEEGSALVTSEARGSGCVLLVSEASGAVCRHMENALVHPVGEVKMLAQHFTMLHDDRSLLERLRSSSLRTTREITWAAAGVRLLQAYRGLLSPELTAA
jgi:glycosyltransferase involved in cell wall biosynthesis